MSSGSRGGKSAHTGPPRPDPPSVDVEVPAPTVPPPPRAAAVNVAELDESTRNRVAEAIARAIAAELGNVRISSIPPPSEPPRSSMRAAAHYTRKGIKWGVLGSGALSLAASTFVWLMRPEYAAPLAQALKLIAGVIVAAAGGGPPSADGTP